MKLTQIELKKILRYEEDTGDFYWIPFSRKKLIRERLAGGVDSVTGYRTISHNRVTYPAHRLVWLYVTGSFPEHVIDHVDGDKTNNRIKNLRDVTHTVNMQNQRKPNKDGTTGVLGVTRKGNKYVAQIGHRKETMYLGIYDTVVEASARYLAVKRDLHEGCTL